MLATRFRAINCNLTLGEYFISSVGEFQYSFLEFDFCFHVFRLHIACCLTSLTKKMRSPHLPLYQFHPPINLSGDVAAQGTFHGCSHWISCQCRLPLLITPTWFTSIIAPSPQPYFWHWYRGGDHWYRGGDHFYPPPTPNTSFYLSYLSLFLHPLTQFIISLTIYISLLSLAISPLTHLISYYFPFISSPKYQCRPPWTPPLRKRRRRMRVWRWQYFQLPLK